MGVISVVVALLIGWSSATVSAQNDTAFVAELERFLTDENTAERFSGVILVARGDRLIFERAFGFADRSRDIPNRPDTKFRIASMTKMFTGVAVAQLAQSKKLKFTDTVSTLLPKLSAPWATKVTVHHLLTHTSGLGSIWNDELRENPGKYRTVADYLPMVIRQQLSFPPGTDWAYSNAGYIVLGAIIEQLTGLNYRTYVRDSIFAKAGMSIGPDDDIDRDVPGRAIPYMRGGLFGLGLVSAEEIGLRTMMPAGGAVLTAKDLWLFARALMKHKLLGKEYTEVCLSGKIRYRQTASYGYGLANEFAHQDTVIFHDGGADGISANMDIFPRTGIIVVVLSNHDHPAVVPYRDKIRDMVTRGVR